jgi:hypothetical protein
VLIMAGKAKGGANSAAFRAGDPRTIELARKGGKVRREQMLKREGKAYDGTILDVMEAAGLTGPSWAAWRVFLKAVFAIELTADELELYQRHTDRERPPEEPVREAWMPIGRRGGKTRIAALTALYLAIRFDTSKLAPGERAVIPVIAADRRQARQVLGYLNGLFDLPEFLPYWYRSLKEAIELQNGVAIEVHTASYRTVRGYTAIGVVCDEIAFWRTDDGAANPDAEVLQALRPAMATVPGGLLLALSSPYATRGELYRAVERSFGRDDARVLVWNGSTEAMNPSVPRDIIVRAFEDDPVAAASEYGQNGRVQFRRDVEAFLDPEALRAVIFPDRRELPPLSGVRYVAFVDPSGGSQDSFTMAVAHAEGDLAVLDALRERRPPFSPDSVVEEYADLLRTFGLSSVTGDRYAGEWPRERFRKYGITYEPSERSKSDIYRELVAPINAGRVALLDLPILKAQLLGLERRVARGGKDSIDHQPGGHDDVANAAAGALVLALPSETDRHRCRVYYPGMVET